MTYDDAITALSNDAVKLVKNHQTIGLGSGRSATSFVKSLSLLIKKKKKVYIVDNLSTGFKKLLNKEAIFFKTDMWKNLDKEIWKY